MTGTVSVPKEPGFLILVVVATVVGFCFLIRGFTNRQLVERVGALLQSPYTSRQATYDLRRLRRKGFIQRIPRTQRYELTREGRRLAVFFTKTYTRIVNPSLAELDPALPNEIAKRSPLAVSYRAFEYAIEHKIKQAAIAA